MKRAAFWSLTAATIALSAGIASAQIFSEGFESGFPAGTEVGANSAWFSVAGKAPLVQRDIGVAGSRGLTPGNRNFHWVGQPFDWNFPSFQAVVVQLDFQTHSNPADSHFPYDDDRIGWVISPDSNDGGDIFGVQMDGGEIEGYWQNASGSDKKPFIVALPTLQPSTYYRFRMKATKLTDVSARIQVSLTELDASGNPVTEVVSGEIADTSTLGSSTPAPKYFSTPQLYATFKNYDQYAPANADNAYLEIISSGAPQCFSEVAPLDEQFAVADIGTAASPATIDYTISNSGLQAIDYTITELDDQQQPASIGWLSVNSATGTVASMANTVVTASLDTTGLVGGRYVAYLKFSDNCSPANDHLRRITLDVYGCRWTVDSCSQERAYMTNHPQPLEDIVYRIDNTGDYPMNYTVTKSGSSCFEWLSLLNDTGTIAAGGHADVVARFNPAALAGHSTDSSYICTLSFADSCSPQTVTRAIKLRYLGENDTHVFFYNGDVDPLLDNSASTGYRFQLYDTSIAVGAVEDDAEAIDGKVWRIVDPDTSKTQYRAYFWDAGDSVWDDIPVHGEAGATVVGRIKVNSWSGNRAEALAIGESDASSVNAHWGGVDGTLSELRRAVESQMTPSTGFVTLRITSVGSEDSDDWTCGRVVRFYLNEDPTPALEITGAAAKSASRSGLIFGAGSSSGMMDISFDWVSGTNAGAFAPGQERAALGRSLVPPFDCAIPFADVDGDGDVDLVDYATFQTCITGQYPTSFDAANCNCFDRDGDADVDEADTMAFIACVTGPAVPFNLSSPPAGCNP